MPYADLTIRKAYHKAYNETHRVRIREQKRLSKQRSRAINPEKYRADCREWYATHREQEQARSRARDPQAKLQSARKWRATNLEQHRAYHREWGRRNLPKPTRPCPKCCECCGKPPIVNALHLDHSHKTGEFRGWLCMKCNTAIAKLGDDIEGLMKAVRYLQEVKP